MVERGILPRALVIVQMVTMVTILLFFISLSHSKI